MAANLQDPAVPVKFIESMFCNDGEQALYQWLVDHKTPKEILDLCQVVFWSYHYTTDALKNNGLVDEVLNNEAPEFVFDGLRILNKMNFDF